ncbi:MAG: type II methionyl aminopeptidase, partial [Candidatus Lokiarchaeota archaeon]|nr:type II methionyl aminopeptidase [Candidatus Lokiarchaeota archaeon]
KTSKKGKEDEEEELTEEEKQEKEEKERVKAFKDAGEIAKKVKKFIRPKIKPGAKLIDLVEAAEKKIEELGGKPGFPVNIGINHIAAHYTPPPGDKTEIKEGDVVKFDMGVHTGDGYTVDTAFTVNLSDDDSLDNLIKAAEDAVDVAVKLIKPGMKTNHVGKQIENKIKEFGFKPIQNLSGHKIEQWNLHAGKEIPCIATPPGSGDTMEEGEVYAVEVFSTNGAGTVHSQENIQIYSLQGVRIPLRNRKSKKLFGYISNEYKTLPFSRWQIYHKFPKSMFGLLEITRSGRLIEHNVLSEKKGRGIYVAQCEHTIIVTENGCEVIT